MTVQDLIKQLEELDSTLHVHAFGVDATGGFSIRSVIGAQAVTRRTRLEGTLGPIALIQTAVYDR